MLAGRLVRWRKKVDSGQLASLLIDGVTFEKLPVFWAIFAAKWLAQALKICSQSGAAQKSFAVQKCWAASMQNIQLPC